MAIILYHDETRENIKIYIRYPKTINYEYFTTMGNKQETEYIINKMYDKFNDLKFRIDDENITFINKREDLEYYKNRKIKRK